MDDGEHPVGPGVTTTATRPLTVAIVGNPNTGKSTLFSALAGVRQRVGNYPGVTVEKKVGRAQFDGQSFTLVDLPGTYSLAPRSPDEMVAVDVLLGRQPGMDRPDAVLCIVDAANLERNLYLVSQVLELGLPTVVALNMIDVADRHGVTIDDGRLARQLGVGVVRIQANRRIGLSGLKTALAAAVARHATPPASPFPAAFQDEVSELQRRVAAIDDGDHRGIDLSRNESPQSAPPRFLVERLLLDTSGYMESDRLGFGHEQIKRHLREARARLGAKGIPVPAVEAMSRYAWVAGVLDGVVTRQGNRGATATDRIDRVLCHKVWGTLVFAAMMVVVFQAVFEWAKPLMDWIDALFGSAGDWVAGSMSVGPLRSLLVDGILAGVGGVVMFLPQIAILFLFIALLEDCGYMARAAYLMDKLMVRVGLSGKSFIPLLSSFACAIPGVMAARVIENRRDRLTTILVAPLMSCSARLPVYAILIAAFIPNVVYVPHLLNLQGLTLFGMYLVGIVAAVAVALTLKRTLLRGETPPFVMELPTYKWPSPRTVLFRIVDRCRGFLRRAGTIILAVSIVVWALLYYPARAHIEDDFRRTSGELREQLAGLPASDPSRAALEERIAAAEAKLDDAEGLAAAQRDSYLGVLGQAIEPAVEPLGWDWRIGCAAIASFPAREVVVATLGVIFNQGRDVDIEDESQRQQLETALADARWEGSDRRLFNVPVALSIMVFFALCAQCAATLAVIKRETNSWLWPAFTFGYMTGLAYVGALVTYQVGMWIAG